MLAPASNLNGNEHFWATVVVTIGTALVLVSLLVSYGVASTLGLGWSAVTLIVCGVVLIWGPIILIVTILFVPVVAPVVSISKVIWPSAVFRHFFGGRPGIPNI